MTSDGVCCTMAASRDCGYGRSRRRRLTARCPYRESGRSFSAHRRAVISRSPTIGDLVDEPSSWTTVSILRLALQVDELRAHRHN